MALFLQETQNQASPAPSLFEAMTALVEYTQEQASMNEALLRADFIVHTQVVALRESGNEAEGKAKEGGLLSKAWALLKEMCEKAKIAIMKVYTWCKTQIQKFWAYIKSKAIAGYRIVISKSKLAIAKAKNALLAVRVKVAKSMIVGGVKVGGEALIKAAVAEVVKAANAGDEEVEIGEGELKTLVDAAEEFQQQLAAAASQGAAKAAEANGDQASLDGVKSGTSVAAQGASDGAAVVHAVSSAKVSKKA